MYEGAVAKRVLQQPHNHRAIIKKNRGRVDKAREKRDGKAHLGEKPGECGKYSVEGR